MPDNDYIVVGSGINGLVCAAMLVLKGRRVLLLERSDRIGGCLRTEAITAPGFVHDVMATTCVLFVTSPAYKVLGPELERRGLAFAQSDHPTGVLRPDGQALVLTRSRDTNRSAFDALGEGDGAAFETEMAQFGANAGLVFSLLGGQLWSRATLKLAAAELWRRGPRGLATFLGDMPHHRARASRRGLPELAGARSLRPMGSPYGPRSGKRLFRRDAEGDRLRARSRRRADRARGRAEAARRLRRG